jgi:hypothetical protein
METMKSLTVAELISELKKMPEDMEVYLYDSECDSAFEILEVEKQDWNKGLHSKHEVVCIHGYFQ